MAYQISRKISIKQYVIFTESCLVDLSPFEHILNIYEKKSYQHLRLSSTSIAESIETVGSNQEILCNM